MLLVRAFAATGDEVAVAATALRVDRAVPARARRGTRSGADRRGHDRGAHGVARRSVRGRAALLALVESGEAAVSAGADRGRDREPPQRRGGGARKRARRTSRPPRSSRSGPPSSTPRRGRTRRARRRCTASIAAAEATGQRAIAASAHRELGYVELLRGDYPRATTWLRTAEELADGDPLELARIHAVTRHVSRRTSGAHDQAADAFEDSIASSPLGGQVKQRAWSLAFLGRTQLLRNELDRAEETLDQARRLARSERWTAFIACPEALAAEVWVRNGRPGSGRRGVRARVRARVPGERRVLGGVRGARARPAPRVPAATSTGRSS